MPGRRGLITALRRKRTRKLRSATCNVKTGTVEALDGSGLTEGARNGPASSAARRRTPAAAAAPRPHPPRGVRERAGLAWLSVRGRAGSEGGVLGAARLDLQGAGGPAVPRDAGRLGPARAGRAPARAGHGR